MIHFLVQRLPLLLLTIACGVCQAQPAGGKFIIVGMGTARDLMTLRAQKVVAQADVLLAEEGAIPAMWADLAVGKEVWEWPHGLRRFFGADPKNLKDPAQRADAIELEKTRRELTVRITAAVKSGKTVACLQSGDPMMYGMTLFLELLPPDVPTDIVPGVGAFQAASAALKRSPPYGYDTNGVILTMDDWPGRADVNEKLMAAGSAMVFYTMNLDYPRLFERLKRFYPPDTPVAVVCDAGDPARQKVIRSTVARFLAEVDRRTLPVNRHLLFVGKFLEAGQARKDFTPRVTEPAQAR
jgi:precorrin-4/cobalt-precorrin-4 C11-methyltransferase